MHETKEDQLVHGQSSYGSAFECQPLYRRILWSTENSARDPGFSRNSLSWGWSGGFSLLSQNSNFCDFQTLLWLPSPLIRRLLSGVNCFYLFTFNPWAINTPGNMTHQPLDIPHKASGLFGPTEIWFWRGAVWFHSLIPLLFSLDSFKDASERLWTMRWPRLCAERRARGKQRKKTSPGVHWQREGSKGSAPPTHSFPLIKGSEEVRAGDKKRGSRRNFCFESSVSQVSLNEGQLGDSGYSFGRCLDGREQTLNGVGALLSGKRTIHLPPVSFWIHPHFHPFNPWILLFIIF